MNKLEKINQLCVELRNLVTHPIEDYKITQEFIDKLNEIRELEKDSKLMSDVIYCNGGFKNGCMASERDSIMTKTNEVLFNDEGVDIYAYYCERHKEGEE